MGPIAAVSCALALGLPTCLINNCLQPFQYDYSDYSAALSDCVVPKGYVDEIAVTFVEEREFTHTVKNEGSVWLWDLGPISGGSSGNLATSGRQSGGGGSSLDAGGEGLPAEPHPDPIRRNADGYDLDVRVVEGRFTSRSVEYKVSLYDLIKLGNPMKLGYLGFIDRPNTDLYHRDSRTTATLILKHSRRRSGKDDEWIRTVPLYVKENAYTSSLYEAPMVGGDLIEPSIAAFVQQWWLERDGIVALDDEMSLTFVTRHDGDPPSSSRERSRWPGEESVKMTAFYIDTWESRVNEYCRQFTNCTSCTAQSTCHWCDLSRVAAVDQSVIPQAGCGYTPLHCAVLGGESFSSQCLDRSLEDHWVITA